MIPIEQTSEELENELKTLIKKTKKICRVYGISEEELEEVYPEESKNGRENKKIRANNG